MRDMAGLPITFSDSQAIISPGAEHPMLHAHRLAARRDNRDRMWEVLAQHPNWMSHDRLS